MRNAYEIFKMDRTVEELLINTLKELEYVVQNAHTLTECEFIDRIINLQGVLNVALSRYYKSSKQEELMVLSEAIEYVDDMESAVEKN